jgi:hypothetical protein
MRSETPNVKETKQGEQPGAAAATTTAAATAAGEPSLLLQT